MSKWGLSRSDEEATAATGTHQHALAHPTPPPVHYREGETAKTLDVGHMEIFFQQVLPCGIRLVERKFR